MESFAKAVGGVPWPAKLGRCVDEALADAKRLAAALPDALPVSVANALVCLCTGSTCADTSVGGMAASEDAERHAMAAIQTIRITDL